MSEQTLARCPKCGHEKETNPVYKGGIYRGTICPACSEWFTVHDDRE